MERVIGKFPYKSQSQKFEFSAAILVIIASEQVLYPTNAIGMYRNWREKLLSNFENIGNQAFCTDSKYIGLRFVVLKNVVLTKFVS